MLAPCHREYQGSSAVSIDLKRYIMQIIRYEFLTNEHFWEENYLKVILDEFNIDLG